MVEARFVLGGLVKCCLRECEDAWFAVTRQRLQTLAVRVTLLCEE